MNFLYWDSFLDCSISLSRKQVSIHTGPFLPLVSAIARTDEY